MSLKGNRESIICTSRDKDNIMTGTRFHNAFTGTRRRPQARVYVSSVSVNVYRKLGKEDRHYITEIPKWKIREFLKDIRKEETENSLKLPETLCGILVTEKEKAIDLKAIILKTPALRLSSFSYTRNRDWKDYWVLIIRVSGISYDSFYLYTLRLQDHH